MKMSYCFTHSSSQDGVCGCPGFWKANTWEQEHPGFHLPITNTTSRPQLPYRVPEMGSAQSRLPSPTCPPKQTCFFWPHGECRRGSQCQFEHKTHITWPIPPPPQYVHRKACHLPLCPLRTDLIEFQQAHMKPEVEQLGGQLDGAMVSTATTEGSEMSDTSSDSEVESELSCADGNRRFLAAGVAGDEPSDSIHSPSISGSQDGNMEAVLHTDELSKASDDAHVLRKISDMRISTTLNNNLEAIDSSLPTSQPSLMNESGKGKDSAADLPDQQISTSTDACTEALTSATAFEMNERGSHEPDERVSVGQPPMGLDSYSSCANDTGSKRRHSSSFDIDASLPDLKHMKRAPTMLPNRFFSEPNTPMDNSSDLLVKMSDWNPPTGPRLLTNEPQEVCFYWYHYGYCNPTSRSNQPRECPFVHNWDNPSLQVKMPPPARRHECNLPLCPIRKQQMENPESNVNVTGLQDRQLGMEMDSDMNFIKGEFRTPSKVEQISEEQYSSSPRDGIRNAFDLMSAEGRPLRRRTGANQLPKLTGAARERFKIQKQRIEQWQAVEPVNSTEPTRKRENRRLRRAMKKQQNVETQRKAKKRQAQLARIAAEEATNALKVPSRIIPLRSGRVVNIYDRSMAGGENTTAGSTLQTRSETVPSTNTVLNHMAIPNTGDELGRGVQGVDNTGTKAQSNSREGQFSPTTVQSYTPQRDQDRQDQRGSTLVLENNDLAATEYKFLVDYELPEGDARLDWDTDYIRQLFGEIA